MYTEWWNSNKQKCRTCWQYKSEVEQCHTLSPLLSHRNMSWSNESNEQWKREIFIAVSWKPYSSVRMGVQSIKHYLAAQRNLDVHAVLFLLDFSVAKCQYLPWQYQNLFPFFLAIMNVSFSITINLRNQCHHKPFYFPASSEHHSGHHFCSLSCRSKIIFFYVW